MLAISAAHSEPHGKGRDILYGVARAWESLTKQTQHFEDLQESAKQ
jgi:hypothetical protein